MITVTELNARPVVSANFDMSLEEQVLFGVNDWEAVTTDGVVFTSSTLLGAVEAVEEYELWANTIH